MATAFPDYYPEAIPHVNELVPFGAKFVVSGVNNASPGASPDAFDDFFEFPDNTEYVPNMDYTDVGGGNDEVHTDVGNSDDEWDDDIRYPKPGQLLAPVILGLHREQSKTPTCVKNQNTEMAPTTPPTVKKVTTVNASPLNKLIEDGKTALTTCKTRLASNISRTNPEADTAIQEFISKRRFER